MKTVLLTGASGGLGLFLAEKLLEKNYFVVLHYCQNEEKVFQLHEKYPNQTFLIQVDFTNENEILQMKETLEKKHILIDYLINNAAIDHVSNLEEKNEKTFLEVLKINLIAPFLLIKSFSCHIEEVHGSIVNVSSDNIIDCTDIVTIEYDVSKMALHQLTKTFAIYFKNAKINTICFGWIDTPMNDFPENIKKDIEFVPLEKCAKEIIKLLKTQKSGTLKVVKK